MTKKIFAMFLAILMVVSVLPTSVFAANECPGNAKDHTKENCDYTVVRVVEPGCGTIGYTVNKCNKCKTEFNTDEVKPTGEHTLVDLEAKAPTCGEYGYEAGQKCSVCGKLFPGAYIDPVVAPGYSCEWTEWAPETVDCTTGGIKTRECKHCGTVEELEISVEETGGYHTWAEIGAKNGFKVITAATPDAPGLASVECLTCKVTKEVVMFYEHEHVWMDFAEVAPKCDADGVEAHRECRACGRLEMFNSKKDKWVKVEAEDLVIPAEHTFDHEPTCVDTMLKCTVCEEYISVSVAHEIDWEEYNWNGRGEYTPATCISSGYMASWCKVCEKFRDVKILPTLGHHSVTVSVPATCNTFAYTFTYCTRPGCAGEITPDFDATIYDYIDLSVGVFAPMADDSVGNFDTDKTERVEGPFYLALSQDALGTDLFITGEMKNGALVTSNDVRDAAPIYLERIHLYRTGMFYVYFLNEEGDKTYINLDIFANEDEELVANVTLDNAPATEFQYNGTMLYTYVQYMVEDTVAVDFFMLTAAGENANVTAINYNVAFDPEAPEQYFVALSDVTAKAPAQVISFKHDVKAGYNANKHVYNPIPEVIMEPTCTQAGEGAYNCIYCNAAVMFEIPAEHDWMLDDDLLLPNGEWNYAYKAADCEDGYMRLKCSKCDAKYTRVLPGYGHYMAIFHKAAPDHVTPVDYTYYECNFCDHRVVLEKKTWDNYGKLYEDLDAALKDHPQIDLTTEPKHTVKGDCEVVGEFRYTCTGCGKSVRVKEAGTGEHLAPAATGIDTDIVKINRTKGFECLATGWYELKLDLTGLTDEEIAELYKGMYLNARTDDGSETVIEAGKIANYTKFFLEKGKFYNFKNDAFKTAGVEVSAELVAIEFVQAPSCDLVGWHITFTCEREDCGKVVGNAAMNKIEYKKMIPHTWEENEEYEAADCETPKFDNYTHTCKVCGKKAYDTELISESWLPTTGTAAEKCEGLMYQYYICHCGEEHIRGFVQFKHNFNRLPDISAEDVENDETGLLTEDDITYKAPTCYEKGYYTQVCEFCGKVEKKDINPVKHTNAAGERFDTTCLTASVTDRHCVVCHEFKSFHDDKGNAHKCDKTTKHEDGTVTYNCEGECWYSWSHKITTTAHPSTCLEDGYYKTVCAYCKAESVSFLNGGWNGHKPTAAVHAEEDCTLTECKDPKHYVRYGNYQYAWFEHVYVDVVDGKLVEMSEEYMAAFVLGENGEPGYIPATYASEGYAKAYCVRCKGVHEWTLPKLEGLGFEVTVAGDEYTYGSLIEVIVSVDGLEELVHGFDFDLDYGFNYHASECTDEDCVNEDHILRASNLLYVGSEVLNDEFMMNVSNAKAALNNGSVINIVAQATNDANGKIRNIVINEKTDLVKLYFRVLANVDGEVEFVINENTAYAYDAEAEKKEDRYVEVYGSYADGSAELRKLADFNNDGFAHITDLYQAMTLLTGEQEDGKTYDVTVDFDKDGVITVEDLLIGYDLYVGNIQDTFFLGMSEAEAAQIVELLGLNKHAYNCINDACHYGSDYAFIICPVCYTAQNQGK